MSAAVGPNLKKSKQHFNHRCTFWQTFASAVFPISRLPPTSMIPKLHITRSHHSAAAAYGGLHYISCSCPNVATLSSRSTTFPYRRGLKPSSKKRTRTHKIRSPESQPAAAQSERTVTAMPVLRVSRQQSTPSSGPSITTVALKLGGQALVPPLRNLYSSAP